jgi:ADP-heptose:LPS heptosyltransferase
MKILIIQLAKLGDLIQSIPLINDLNEDYPAAEICLLHSEVFSECANFIRNITPLPVNLDKIIKFEDNAYKLNNSPESASLINFLNESHFDKVINLNSTSVASGLLQKLNTPDKSGFGANNQQNQELLDLLISFMKNRNLSVLNLSDAFRKLHKNNYNQDYWQKDHPLKDSKDIIIQLGSRNSKRNPSLSFFASLSDKLLQNGYNIVFSGVKSESPLADECIKKMNYKSSVKNLTGKTSLSELHYLISQAKLLITGDTGTMHLAGLTNTEILALLGGSAYPFETMVYSSNAKAYLKTDDTCPLYPCPEFYNCSHNYVCTEFQVDRIITLIQSDNLGENAFQTYFDDFGQFLVPQKKEISQNYLLSLIWRIIFAEFITKKPFPIDFYSKRFLMPNDLISDAKNLISREFLLADRLSELTDFNIIAQNFKFLAPALIFNLIHKKKSGLAELLNPDHINLILSTL